MNTENPPKNQRRQQALKRISLSLTQFHFWAWNLLFMAVALFAVVPHLLIEAVAAFFTGQMPASIFFGIVGLVMIPVVSLIIGLRNAPKHQFLFKFFYGVELPAIGFLMLRVFMLKTTPTVADFFLFLGGAAIVLYGIFLWRERDGKDVQGILGWLGSSVILWSGVTVGVVMFLFNLPLVLGFISNVLMMGVSLEGLLYGGFTFLLVSAFSLVSIIVYFVFPAMYIWLCVNSWQRWCTQGITSLRVMTSITIVVLLSVGIYVSNYLSQRGEFTVFTKASESDCYRPSSAYQYAKVDRALINTYLNTYRFPLNTEGIDYRGFYDEMLDSEVPILSVPSEQITRYLIAPFIYRGGKADGAEAEVLYARIFDEAIQKEHRSRIKSAMQANYEPSTAEAGLLELEEKNVTVVEQALTVIDHESWADVELYEVYQNNTFESQEVFYYFSLPEHAAIKALYLGNSPDKKQAFSHRVSPRGAAQQVYKEQRVKNVDPALLEQVGPHQYRLRIFPIPAKERGYRSLDVEVASLHLWIEMEIIKDEEGLISMPVLLEKRNTEFGKKRKRSSHFSGETKWRKDEWLPEAIDTEAPDHPLKRLTLDGYSIPLEAGGFRQLAPGEKIAVIVDSSYSMRPHLEKLTETLEKLKSNQVSMYLAESSAEKLQPLVNGAEISPHGTVELAEIMNQYLESDLPVANHIIIVTDEGGYEVSSDRKLSSEWKHGSLNILHLGNYAPAYSDVVVDVLQETGGRVSMELEQLTPFREENIVTEAVQYDRQENQPQSIAARLLIAHLAQAGATKPTDLEKVHAIAKKYDVVTPYSSMIVLVNSQQHRRLDELETKKDKFDREVDSGVTTIRANNQLPIDGSIPEPSTVFLLLISCGYALGVRRR